MPAAPGRRSGGEPCAAAEGTRSIVRGADMLLEARRARPWPPPDASRAAVRRRHGYRLNWSVACSNAIPSTWSSRHRRTVDDRPSAPISILYSTFTICLGSPGVPIGETCKRPSVELCQGCSQVALRRHACPCIVRRSIRTTASLRDELTISTRVPQWNVTGRDSEEMRFRMPEAQSEVRVAAPSRCRVVHSGLLSKARVGSGQPVA